MKRLFIENFDRTTTQEAILDLFKSRGKVDSVTLHTGSRGESLGYAFVVMENDGEAVQAMRALNNKPWNGSRLTVTPADQPSMRSAGFSGGASVLSRKQK